MAAFRMFGRRSLGLGAEELSPGDTVLSSESFSTVATVGNATISAGSLVTGVLYRSGSTGNYTDTFDTAANVLAALAGNAVNGAIVAGHSFKLRIVNTVAFTETITLGSGMTAGSGNITSVGTSSFRDFLFQITSAQPVYNVVCNGTSGNAALTFALNTGQSSLIEGPAPNAVNIMPGAAATSATSGIQAGSTVSSVTQGQGGVTGVVLSGTLTANFTNVSVQFGPAITVNSSGSGNL